MDNVNHPNHYTSGKVECIDALESATVNLQGIEAVCTANAIKYLWRWKQKNGTEDLKKSIWYIDRLLKEQTADDKQSKLDRIHFLYEQKRLISEEIESLGKELNAIEDLEAFSIDGV